MQASSVSKGDPAAKQTAGASTTKRKGKNGNKLSQEEIANHEKNGELVLNLEQSSLDELYAKPRPKDSPTGTCNGLGDKPRRGNKGRNQGDKPSKGAGMNGEIGNGW